MALTGYRVGEACYASLQDAADAFYSTLPVQYLPSSSGGVDAVVHARFPSSGYWYTQVYHLANGTKTLESQNWIYSPTVQAGFPPCDPTQFISFTDAFRIPVSGDVATVWMLGFGIPMMLYLAAWGYGVVLGMFNHKSGD